MTRSSTALTATQAPSADTTPHRNGGYTSSQTLPALEDNSTLPQGGHTTVHLPQKLPPVPHPWTPRFNPQNWIYTNGSDIKDQSRLGASVVHVPTRTAIYIEVGGSKETRTVMRLDLIAMHTALTTSTSHD